jgi:16S rRNA (guanine966-N2)-methyltransferase
VRVIGGELRGRPLKAPPGRSTRPTADRVREALFNLLGPVREGGRVLDLFAGSGALGIEALSRGATQAVFLESDRRARKILRENLASLELEVHSTVLGDDVLSRGSTRLEGSFDLVFADPPYNAGVEGEIVARYGASLAPGGVLALEQAAEAPPPEPIAPLVIWKTRRYGGTRLTLYRNSAEECA